MDTERIPRPPRPITPKPPKTSPCDGCGRRHLRRGFLELVEGEHDGLTFFDGDLLCEGCAVAHGVR